MLHKRNTPLWQRVVTFHRLFLGSRLLLWNQTQMCRCKPKVSILIIKKDTEEEQEDIRKCQLSRMDLESSDTRIMFFTSGSVGLQWSYICYFLSGFNRKTDQVPDVSHVDIWDTALCKEKTDRSMISLEILNILKNCEMFFLLIVI